MGKSGIRSGEFTMLSESDIYGDPYSGYSHQKRHFSYNTAGSMPAFGGDGDVTAYLPPIENNMSIEDNCHTLNTMHLAPQAKGYCTNLSGIIMDFLKASEKNQPGASAD